MDSQQQQQQQTEKLIAEMLDFLESTSDEEEDYGRVLPTNNGHQEKCVTAINGNEGGAKKPIAAKVEDKCKKDNSTTAKELKTINQKFPIWNTREIVANQKKSLSLPQSPINDDSQPIWRQSSLSLLDKPLEAPETSFPLPPATAASADQSNNCRPKLEINFLRSNQNNNSYVQEVRKAIYCDTRGHPVADSADYFQAAQNYAVYGKDFLDFPQDLKTILENKVITSAADMGSFNNGIHTPTPTWPGRVVTTSYNTIDGSSSMGVNSFGKSPVHQSTCTTLPMGTTSANPTVAAVASTAAYYQLCNSITSQTRPVAGNTTPAVGATSYGMFLGNKVTYVAATPNNVPTLVYNQQHSTPQGTTNFISNSLANAALATSPAILYTNPMLTATAQHYLNTFFKESQFLSTATTASAAAAGATIGGGNSTQASAASAGIYERLVYAQMLQQQLYHQSQQQAAVVAAMLHKQRINAAAAAAANVARQAANTSGLNTNTGPPPPPQAPANNLGCTAAPSLTTSVNLNNCARQVSLVANNSSPSQTCIALNGNEESSKINKE